MFNPKLQPKLQPHPLFTRQQQDCGHCANFGLETIRGTNTVTNPFRISRSLSSRLEVYSLPCLDCQERAASLIENTHFVAGRFLQMLCPPLHYGSKRNLGAFHVHVCLVKQRNIQLFVAERHFDSFVFLTYVMCARIVCLGLRYWKFMRQIHHVSQHDGTMHLQLDMRAWAST